MESWEMPIDTGEVPADGSDFDVIVVGGGREISVAAYNALNGCKVLLIENVWPRDKVCGDAVGGKSLSHVEGWEFFRWFRAPRYQVDSILFGSASGSEVRVMLPKAMRRRG